jgi:hypothetical protein
MRAADPPDPASDAEVAIITSVAVAVLPSSPLLDGSVVPHLPIPNPLGGVGSLFGDGIVGTIATLLRAVSSDFLRQLAVPTYRFVLHTPDLLTEPTLRRFWLISFTTLVSLAGLMLAIAGTALITGRSSRIGLAAREAVGVRLIAAVLTAAVSLPVVALEVQLANRITDALVPAAFVNGDSALSRGLFGAASGDAAAGLAVLVTAVVGVVLLVTLVVLSLARWATLWLLVVLAPLAMGASMLPTAGGIARVWWRLQVATVFLPVAHAALLGAYVGMFASHRSGLLGALSGVAVLALMTKLPRWVAEVAVGVEHHELSGRFRQGLRTSRRVAVAATGIGPAGVVGTASASTAGAHAASTSRLWSSTARSGPSAAATPGATPP